MMRSFKFQVLLLLAAYCLLPAAYCFSQTNARRERRGNGAPPATCTVSSGYADVYVDSATGKQYACKTSGGGAGTGTWVEATLAAGLSSGFTTTATAAATTTLTVASTGTQEFTGATTQTVLLPVVSTLPRTGFPFMVINRSSGIVIVQSSGANTIQAMAANTTAIFTCVLLTGTTAASWDVTYIGAGGITNSAGANVVPVSNGTNLIAGSAAASATLSNPSTINIDSGAGTTTIGDVNGAFSNLQLKLDATAQTATLGIDASNTLLLVVDDANSIFSVLGPSAGGAQFILNKTTLLPNVAGETAIASNVLPFSSIFIGNAATNNIQLTGTATGARVATLPDVTGTVQVTPAASTFAALPASPFTGQQAVINNCSTNVLGAAADGAGALTVLVWWTGAAWHVLGK